MYSATEQESRFSLNSRSCQYLYTEVSKMSQTWYGHSPIFAQHLENYANNLIITTAMYGFCKQYTRHNRFGSV